MEGLELVIGCLIWFFGVIGFLTVGKKFLPWFQSFIAQRSEGFRPPRE